LDVHSDKRGGKKPNRNSSGRSDTIDKFKNISNKFDAQRSRVQDFKERRPEYKYECSAGVKNVWRKNTDDVSKFSNPVRDDWESVSGEYVEDTEESTNRWECRLQT
jgi:hypothetical protein